MDTKPKLPIYLLTGLVILFCSACFFFIRLDSAAANSSSLGIAALRQMSAQATPYQTALSNNKPTLIEFYADWCTSCQALAPSISQFHEKYGSQINFVMLNVDEPQVQQQIQQYQVKGVPQFFFIKSDEPSVPLHDRTVIKTLVGAVPQPILGTWFEKLLHPTS
ncbi:MAG: thioredoxin domain-containing protein [Coleofasciculaceae cyanobacterium]